MRVPVLVMLALMAATAAEAAANVSMRMIEPRSFGYVVGDVFRREAEIFAPDPYRLDPASLPAPGHQTYWLDLKSVDLSEKSVAGGHSYRLILDYQTFYVPLQPTRLSVPGLTLKFTGGAQSIEAEVPSWSFVAAAIREIAPEKPEEGPVGYLRPDAVPTLIDTRRERVTFAIALAGAAIALLLLARHQAWWPFRVRPSRPFTLAARAIGRRAAQSMDREAYRASLLDLHRAFDASAGRRVLAEDVPIFLKGHDAFAPMSEDIARFFASSRRAFFGNDLAGAANDMPLGDVAALGKRLGQAERKAA